MAGLRYASYLRRRDDRLREEDDRRALRAQERALEERLEQVIEEAQRAIADEFVMQQAAQDAIALGQVLPH